MRSVLHPTDRCAPFAPSGCTVSPDALRTPETMPRTIFSADVIALSRRQRRARLGSRIARRRLYLHIQDRPRHGNRRADTAHEAVRNGLARVRRQGIGRRRHRVVPERLHAQRQDRVLVGDSRHHAADPSFP